jgi:hypothetical protein
MTRASIFLANFFLFLLHTFLCFNKNIPTYMCTTYVYMYV